MAEFMDSSLRFFTTFFKHFNQREQNGFRVPILVTTKVDFQKQQWSNQYPR